MSEKPILFSGPMVRAILEGRKSMTRRIVKPQPLADGYYEGPVYCDRREAVAQFPACFLFSANAVGGGAVREEVYEPPYAPGDVLWVREAHAIVGNVDPGFVLYRANGYEAECERHGFDKPYPPESEVRWRPSIHMPRWASRITLRVTAVKVERLQDITEADAEAEGANPILVPPDGGSCPHVEGFRELWQSLHGPGSWDANPWVAAYSFERITP